MDNQFTYNAYSNHLKEHRLMGSKDVHTGEVFLPPRPLNPHNFSTDMEWVEFAGEGMLQAYTIVYIGTSAMIEAGYNRKNPYCVGIVKTKEGPMISTLIVGVDPFEPEAIEIGAPLKVKFIDHGEGEGIKTLLAFEPA
jgi:uncharacterized protein